MQHAHHQVRTFSARNGHSVRGWQWAIHTVLVAAAFAFVAAVTLGLFP